MHKILAGGASIVNQDNRSEIPAISPQISICVVSNSTKDILDLVQNCSSFFGKYKIPWELSLVCSNQKDHDNIKIGLESLHLDHFQVRASIEAKNSRAQKVWHSLHQAHGKYRTLVDTKLSTPLADILKMSQLLMEDPHLKVIFGNRYGMPNSQIRQQVQYKKIQRELTFKDILTEKKKTKLSDPFSESFVIKDKAFEGLTQQNFTGWYFTHSFEKICVASQIHYAEAPIHASAETTELAWTDKLHLFFSNLF